MTSIVVNNPYVLFAGSGFTVDLPATTQPATSTKITPLDAWCGWRFNVDGTVDRMNSSTASNTGWAYNHDWGTPTGGSPGDDYEIKATLNSGTIDAGDSTGSWLALSTLRRWEVSRTSLGTDTANITIDIRPTGGSSEDNQTYTFSSTVDIDL
jgi:hypothetical protein